jgi:hypothetical protein
VQRPGVPVVQGTGRNAIDSFVAAEREKRGLSAVGEAAKGVLLRRVYLDLIGLSPTPAEVEAFEGDESPGAYEKVVDRLLADPRYGERWGRHWMDVWRYSDWAGWTDGGQIRDSQPHIWHWRDWIVESLNKDMGYGQMVVEMLAADELMPEDEDALRATGFLARNYKMLSREQWLEDTVNHTSKAFLGLTMHCAKCHDHKFDPISQVEYYQMRAIFEPHQVRLDRVVGEADTKKNGLPRVYDADVDVVTNFYIRGDERRPDKEKTIVPGVPKCVGGALQIEAKGLPKLAAHPDRRGFVVQETVAASGRAVADARKLVEAAKGDKRIEAESNLAAMEARHAALLAVIGVEKLEDAGKKDSVEWKQAAADAVAAQRRAGMLEAVHNLLVAQHGQAAAKNEKEIAAAKVKIGEAEKAVVKAGAELNGAATVAYKPRGTNDFPEKTSGRRLAFARWITDSRNPLTARVAMNHIWLRHFGQAIVPSVMDFGAGGRAATHPQLLDWLAAEFMANGWKMKPMHRLIVTSSTYRMASTPNAANSKIDADDIYYWRMPSRRMEAEVVRDNVLYASGQLDLTMGGPDIDHKLALASRRRSIYLQIAAEKEAEFLKVFDSPSVTECYERRPSVMPQQALALSNSELVLRESRTLTGKLAKEVGEDNDKFVGRAYMQVLSRRPKEEELKVCREFLAERGAKGRENLVLVLFNHNDFVTIR